MIINRHFFLNPRFENNLNSDLSTAYGNFRLPFDLEGGMEKPKTLIGEDDSDFSKMFFERDYKINVATQGSEVLDKIRPGMPTLMIREITKLAVEKRCKGVENKQTFPIAAMCVGEICFTSSGVYDRGSIFSFKIPVQSEEGVYGKNPDN